MKLLVLGSTGGSGIEVIKEALSRSHEVLAIARNPEKIDIQHTNLTVRKANIFEPNDLEGPIRECDAVVSCLGCDAGFLGRTPTTFYTASMTSLTAAMRAAGKKRLVCMSSWCTLPGTKTLWFAEWIMRPFVIGNLLKNLSEMEDVPQTELLRPGLHRGQSPGPYKLTQLR
ncbi:uncharacterized protein LOC117342611 [Pecten maximus]|uniref:uncharacterized protein LOC117342611 n=1 Tax=Pecten maximus TaxID=6579 RepID=UPI001458DFA6|nr:uncharacterized protein LOC117342611 [Pecten maximus]